MSLNNVHHCPNEDKLIEYLLQTLSFIEVKNLEEHFCICQPCADKVRMFSEFYFALQSLKASPELAQAYKESSSDLAILPAAGSETLRGISEVKSIHGKYIIKLIPFLHGNKSVLEVQVLDKSLQGNLIIENEEAVIFSAPIKNGYASQEVVNPVDLKNILIRVQI